MVSYTWGNSLLTHLLDLDPLTILQVSLESPYPLNRIAFAPKLHSRVLSCTFKSSSHLVLLLFLSKPGLFSPSVWSSCCHLQARVSCFSHGKEITPATTVCTLYAQPSLWLTCLFSTSGRKNPQNMTITRFASILVTIGKHQSAGMEDTFF